MHKSVKDNLRQYVDRIFDNTIHFTNEEISKFGFTIEDSEARYIFAKELDSRRSRCLLDVTSYHKLLHSVALTLFESSRQDNYSAGSILMNMAFTYHYAPKGPRFVKRSGHKEHRVIPKSGKSDRRSFAAKCRYCLTNLFVCCHSNSWSKNDDRHNENYLVPCSGKIFLYESLKNLTVWKSLRFWDEIFFVAVGSERTKRCTSTSWSLLDAEERVEYNTTVSNITFGHMTSFLNNMKLLELPVTTRMEFFMKQCEIGGIPAKSLMYHSLRELV